MKKERKSRDFYTLNKELYDEFLKHIEENNLNKSKLIETLIEEYMKTFNQNDDIKNKNKS
jgi:metal-responsive CopG/Arc/MetJ family transcriptional regulator